MIPSHRLTENISVNPELNSEKEKDVKGKLTEESMYEVLSPLGEKGAALLPSAPRLDTLNGKTICEIANGGYRSDEVFPFIEELLKKEYPGIKKIIRYTDMPRCDVPDLSVDTRGKTIEAIIAAIKENGCDAVIGGMGA
jgi:hypothetical protein